MKYLFVIAVLSLAAAIIESPVYARDRTAPIGVQQNPPLNATSAPSICVANVPMVKSDTADTVTAATKHATVPLWSSNQTIANGASLHSAVIDCSGYKEVRVVMQANPSSELKAWFYYTRPDGVSAFSPGYFNFAPAANPFSNQANFTPNTAGHCMFSMPIYSDKCFIVVQNDIGAAVVMESVKCWAYLVN